MNINQLRDLIALIDTSDINVLELKQPGSTLRLEIDARSGTIPATASTTDTTSATLPAATAASTAPAVITVPAPGFGIFTTRHPSHATAFCQDDQRVAAGDTLALLRINELYIPVTSNATGKIRQLVEEGSLIGYGTPLFEIIP
jgi:acetyl-CoA carboxylase biotin carboxyl carrier protein